MCNACLDQGMNRDVPGSGRPIQAAIADAENGEEMTMQGVGHDL